MLYFVSTPIGNLNDITLRALDVLNNVDVIFCEDTRVSLKLLNHYNINKKLMSYHKYNENKASETRIDYLEQNKNIAIISDAGMPVISDPGETLIKKLKELNLAYTIIPGANAGLCALILSGLDASRFYFIGFIPDEKKERKKVLASIKYVANTLVFYVAPHDVCDIVKELYLTLGERRAVLVNEITKMFEKSYEFKLCEDFIFEAKGEYVLVVEGAKNDDKDFDNMSIEEHLKYYLNLNETKNEAIKRVAKERGLSKNEVYQVAIKLKD